METTRQNKISRLLQKELSEIFRQETQQDAWRSRIGKCRACKPRFECGESLSKHIPVGKSGRYARIDSR